MSEFPEELYRKLREAYRKNYPQVSSKSEKTVSSRNKHWKTYREFSVGGGCSTPEPPLQLGEGLPPLPELLLVF